MAGIATTDVTYTQVGKAEVTDASYRKRVMTVAFGNGTLTYPAGGVPLVAGKLGCPNTIRSCVLFSPASANGFVYKYDEVNNKIRIYQGDNTNVASAPLIELLTSATPAAATLYVEATGY